MSKGEKIWLEDKVKIVENLDDHEGYKKGQVVEVIAIDDDGYYTVEGSDGTQWYVDGEELKLVKAGSRKFGNGGGVGGTFDSSSTGEVIGGTFGSSQSGEMIGGTMASSMYKNGGNLLGSAPSLDSVKKLISQFYMGSTISLHQIGDSDEYEVHNLKGKINGVKVVKNKGRYRFISENKFSKGGGVGMDENRLMVMNNNKQISHHSEELANVLKNSKHVPAWVVSKVYRSASDLSDVTHYLDGSSEQYAKGGNTTSGWCYEIGGL